MNYAELGQNCFELHNEPFVKIEIPPSKYLLDSGKDHTEKKGQYQENLKKSVECVKAERRSARNEGIWMENSALCKITKTVCNILENFGFQDKTGIYLLPEETLFLIEENKLQLIHNTRQVDISEAYTLLTSHITLEKYRVYKNFVEQGFKLLNKEAIRKFHSIKTENCKRKSSNNNKRKLTDSNDSEVPVKLTIKNTVDDKIEGFKTNFESRTEEDFLEVLEKFREEGPKLNSSYDSVQQPDYFGFFPISRCKQNHDFNLYIREECDTTDFDNYEHIPNVLAIYHNDDLTIKRCSYENSTIIDI